MKWLSRIILTAFAVSSCMGIEYSGYEEEPEGDALVLLRTFSDAARTEPAAASIAMTGTSVGNRNIFRTGDDGRYPENGDTLRLSRGEYMFLAYSGDEAVEFPAEEDFLNGRIALKSLPAVIRELPDSELKGFREGSAIDFNAPYKFIRSPEFLMCGSLRKTLESARTDECRIIMDNLLVELTFKVNIMTDDGVSVRSVTAELSGVPDRLCLSNGVSDTDNLSRVIFTMEKSGSSYLGKVRAAGLFPSALDGLKTGPGIFRLAISAESDGVSRMFYPAVNLSGEIRSRGIMKEVPGEGYRAALKKAEISIGNPLRISSDSFSGEGTEGLEDWYDSGIYFDVEI